MAGALTVKRVEDEQLRQQGYQLLRHRVTDTTMHIYLPAHLPTGEATQLELFNAELNNEIVGAAYVGPDWGDLTHMREVGWPPESVDEYRDRILYLHGIATREDASGRGVAQALLGAVETYARDRGCRAIIGVTDPAAAGFYRRHGFALLGHEVTIAVPVASAPMLACWPIEGSAQWFAKPLIPGAIAKVPPGFDRPVPLTV